MRLVLAATAALAAVAAVTAVPASAALPDYACTVRVVHSDPGGPSSSCETTGAPRVESATFQNRVLDVVVAAGAVRASITCRTPWGYDATVSDVFYPAAQRQYLQTEQDYGTCVTSLDAVADDTSAVGVATFSYSFVRK